MTSRPTTGAAPDLRGHAVGGDADSLRTGLAHTDLKLFHEIEELSKYIESARHEIADLRAEKIRPRQIPAATDELDAIIVATEAATGTILDSAETIERVASSLHGDAKTDLAEAVTRIYEACNFQDITGQRITKVVKTLKHIEIKLEGLMRAFGNGSDPLEPPATGINLLHCPARPSASTRQDEIDALLASLN